MKKLLATLLILCAGPVWAEWVQYSVNDQGEKFFFDPSTIRGKTIKKVWMKQELLSKNEFGWLSYRALNEVDCANERVRSLGATGFSKPKLSGDAVHNFTFPDPSWRYVAPESVDKELFNRTCGTK
jgi:hypothetical protein